MIIHTNRYNKDYSVNNISERGSIEMQDLDLAGKKIQNVAIKTMMFLSYLAEEELKPGDIILSYYPDSYSWKDVVIKGGQSFIEKPFSEDSSNYVHAAIYLGNGKVAESVKNGLRIHSLTSERFKMNVEHTNEFRVFRPQNEDLAKEAAHLGGSIAEEDATKTEGVPTYNYLTAVLAVFKENNLTDDAIERYLKAAYFAHTGEVPYDKNGIQNFHCSYVVAWLFQGAEAKDVIGAINADLPEGKKIKFPNLSKEKTPKEKAKALDKWAREVTKNYSMALGDIIKMNVDAKGVSVQRFYKFIKDNPEHFKLILRLISPPAPGSEKELENL